MKKLFWNADTTTFRFIFSLSSISLAGFMLLNWQAFALPEFRVMRYFLPVWIWACLFALHWALLTWRFLDPVPRVVVSLAINCYGFALWTLYIVAQDLSLGYFAIDSSAERVLLLFSFWTIVRTGTRPEVLSP